MSTAVAIEQETELPERYEVVNGQIVEISPIGRFASEIANNLRDELTIYARTSKRGRTRNDMLFRIPLAEDATRSRVPDVAFISFDRWPENRRLPYRGIPDDVMPNLVVEVASPSDNADALLEKAHEYLQGGAELVWIVFPRARQLYAYTAINVAPRLYTRADTLDGGTVLPGFSVPMAGLFPELIAEPESPPDDE